MGIYRHSHRGNILNQDVDTNTPGVQVYSTNGAITLRLLGAPGRQRRAASAWPPLPGMPTAARRLTCSTTRRPPHQPGVSVTAGQSRIWVSWQTNSEPDTRGLQGLLPAGTGWPALGRHGGR